MAGLAAWPQRARADATPHGAAHAAADGLVSVQRFVVTGNTLLAPETIELALQPFKGERRLRELQAAAARVQALYREAGYGAVIAYLPEQSGPPGTVTIAVLEGRIARVVVLGHERFSADNVRRSLPLLREGRTPPVQALDQQIQMANQHPAKTLAVVLEPGQQPGEVDARIRVSEQAPSRWWLDLDNSGNRATGRLRLGLGYQHSALWDLDHQLSLQYQLAPERLDRVAIVSANYRVPFYAQGLTLDSFFAYSNVDGGSTDTAVGALRFSGRGRVLGLRLSQQLPRWGHTEKRLAWGLDQRSYLNDCAIEGLSADVCGPAGASVTVHPLTLEYAAQHQGGGALSLGGQIALSHNLGLGGRYGHRADFEAARPGARQRYTSLHWGLGLRWALPKDWMLLWRAKGQNTRDLLVSGEQYGIAGAQAVRAYSEREITGDSALVLSVELVSPLLAAAAAPAGEGEGWRLLAFADAGEARKGDDTPCREARARCSLASVGLGARLSRGPLQLQFDLAQALKNGSRTQRHDWRLHLQGIYHFR